jgi:IPT/TIG domain
LLAPHFAHAVTGGPYFATDSNGNQVESVNIDARGSHTHRPGDEIVSAVWKKGSTVLGNGLVTTLSLPVGVHTVSLTVKDRGGDTNTDTTTITVYDAGSPYIASLSPSLGGIAGGTVVTIAGTSFLGATAVRFGLALLTGSAIVVESATSIRVTAPYSGIDIPVEVSVITPAGESNSKTFTYVGSVPIDFTPIAKLLDFPNPTAIAFGPDSRLYLGNTEGQLGKFTLNDSFDAVVSSVIAVITSSSRGIHGITFDPNESADMAHPTIYVSTSDIFHGESRSSIGAAINGKIQAVRGANMEQVTDIVENMPVSQLDHTVR